MGKYGEAAIKAVNIYKSGDAKSPQEAWEKATIELFGEDTEGQRKGCPKGAFLGLCEEGKIKGIPRTNHTRLKLNKCYAIKAVKILKKEPELASNQKALWNKVAHISHNQQMDVVIALWENKLIVL